MAQFNMLKFRGVRSWKFGVGRTGFLDADIDEFRARTDTGVHAPRGDEFRRFTYGDAFEQSAAMLRELRDLLLPS